MATAAELARRHQHGCSDKNHEHHADKNPEYSGGSASLCHGCLLLVPTGLPHCAGVSLPAAIKLPSQVRVPSRAKYSAMLQRKSAESGPAPTAGNDRKSMRLHGGGSYGAGVIRASAPTQYRGLRNLTKGRAAEDVCIDASGSEADALGAFTMPSKPTKQRWSAEVTKRSDALDLKDKVFQGSSKQIAKSLKRSAEHSDRRKSSPFRSAMSMLTFYINRAGKNLSKSRRRMLESAKKDLRQAFGRER